MLARGQRWPVTPVPLQVPVWRPSTHTGRRQPLFLSQCLHIPTFCDQNSTPGVPCLSRAGPSLRSPVHPRWRCSLASGARLFSEHSLGFSPGLCTSCLLSSPPPNLVCSSRPEPKFLSAGTQPRDDPAASTFGPLVSRDLTSPERASFWLSSHQASSPLEKTVVIFSF